MDREKVIQEIAVVLCTLERSGEEDIERVKKFLRWLPDSALQDVRNKHKVALESVMQNRSKSSKEKGNQI